MAQPVLCASGSSPAGSVPVSSTWSMRASTRSESTPATRLASP